MTEIEQAIAMANSKDPYYCEVPHVEALRLLAKELREQQARIAALELALDHYVSRQQGHFEQIIEEREEYIKGCILTDQEIHWAQSCIEALKSLKNACFEARKKALSGSKLGELFQALLVEHNMPDNKQSDRRYTDEWLKAEALRKECGL